MTRNYYLLGIFLLPFTICAQHTDRLFLDAAISKLQDAKLYTMQVASAMPEDKYDFKPVPEEMSFGKQMLHLAENIGWLTASYLDKSKNPVNAADMEKRRKVEIIAVLAKSYDFALRALQHFDEKQLPDTVSFFAGPMNKLQIIDLLNDHQTHHRAQAIVYLRLNGIKPPDYKGW